MVKDPGISTLYYIPRNVTQEIKKDLWKKHK